MPHRYILLHVLILSVLLAGCVSTKKRYERAEALEAKGRYAEAAAYYAKVLDREPTWEEARTGLQETGARAVGIYLEEADAAAGAGDYERALSVLARLDGLRARARSVGVALEVPDDYEAFRQELTAGAVAAGITRGEQAEAAQRWPEALRAYEHVQQRYALPPRQHADLDRARARVLLRWSEQEMLREHYRAAHSRAQQAIDLLGPDAPQVAPAHELQREALAAGTRYAVFVPLWSVDAVTRAGAAPLLQDLNDVLHYEYWAAPPLFVGPTDPAALHRELRRFLPNRRGLRGGEAAEIGRVLGADFVVLGELTAFERSDLDLKERRQRARTRGPAPRDTAYVVQQFTRALRGEARYYLVDPYSRRIISEGSVHATATGPQARAIYGGNPAELDLSLSDRRLFDGEEQRLAEIELERVFVDEMAAAFADRVYGMLLDRIE